MPNLVGILDPRASEGAIREALRAQLDRIRIRGSEGAERIFAVTGFGMALQDTGILDNGPQPAVAPGGGAVLLDGEVWNADEVRCAHRAELPDGRIGQAELCLRLLSARGEAVAAELNGFFVVAWYDVRARTLRLISDHLGCRPLFYAQRGGVFVFGTELKAVAAADPGTRQIDAVGTLELFAYGTHFMDRTWIEGYRKLPPATVLTVDAAGGVKKRCYWRYRYHEGAPRRDQVTYVTVYARLLQRAVERCLRGGPRIGIFLSGGYDSRAVAAAIPPHVLPMPAFTFGLPESRDVRFAAQLAARLGLEHHAVTAPDAGLLDCCHAVVWRTEGMLPFHFTTSIRHHDLLKRHMDVVLLGFLSEFGGSHLWPRLLLARGREAAKGAIYEKFPGRRLGALRRLFRSDFLASNWPALRERFDRSFEVVENEHPHNIADCWNVLHLQPRGTFQSPAVDRHRLEMRAPHCDFELLRFLLEIPPWVRIEQRVYKKMIAASFPAIRDVPCTNSGRPIDPWFPREYARMAIDLAARRILSPLRRLFGGRDALGREPRDAASDFRREPALAHGVLMPMLREGVFPSAIFDHGGIETLVREHYEGSASHEMFLSQLISWGLAVRLFLQDDLRDAPASLWAPPSAAVSRRSEAEDRGASEARSG